MSSYIRAQTSSKQHNSSPQVTFIRATSPLRPFCRPSRLQENARKATAGVIPGCEDCLTLRHTPQPGDFANARVRASNSHYKADSSTARCCCRPGRKRCSVCSPHRCPHPRTAQKRTRSSEQPDGRLCCPIQGGFPGSSVAVSSISARQRYPEHTQQGQGHLPE